MGIKKQCLLCSDCAQAASYDEWSTDDRQFEATKAGLEAIAQDGYLSLDREEVETFFTCHVCHLNDGEYIYSVWEHVKACG